MAHRDFSCVAMSFGLTATKFISTSRISKKVPVQFGRVVEPQLPFNSSGRLGLAPSEIDHTISILHFRSDVIVTVSNIVGCRFSKAFGSNREQKARGNSDIEQER
jgi:hypothetical protein